MSQRNERYPLTPEDREVVEGLLEFGVDTKDKRGFVLSVLHILRENEATGDDGAVRIIDTMACNGLYRALDNQARRKTGIFKDVETGRVLNVPKRGSIRVVAKDGTPTGERQLVMWQEMNRAEFDEWANSQIHLAESMRFKTRGIRRVQLAWELHPDAVTARDACLLAGIDPDELELDHAA